MAIVINGSGTVTGLAVGGLPDGTVDAGTLASGIDKTSITDGGNATAMTINSSEQVGIGTGSPSETLHAYKASSADAGLVNVIKVQTSNNNSTGDGSAIAFHGIYNSAEWGFGKIGGANSGSNWGGALEFHTNAGNNSSPSIAYTKQLTITQDGRGLSQFTAKAWARIDMDGTFTVNDSHNVSSVTDQAEGNCRVIFDVDMANANYNMSTCGGGASSNNTLINVSAPQDQVTTTHVDLDVTYVHGTANDAGNVNVMIFGD